MLLERLEKNEDFQKVIIQGYMTDKVFSAVSCLGVPSFRQNGRAELMEELVSISNLRYYFDMIKNMGSQALVDKAESWREKMSDYSDEELFDMSNEELEQAYKNLDKSDEEVSDEQVQEEEDSTEEVAKSSEEVVEEDNSLDEPEKEIEEQVSSELYKIRANGEDYEFALMSLKKLAPKALNYTKRCSSYSSI